jgi:hypothetical protein
MRLAGSPSRMRSTSVFIFAAVVMSSMMGSMDLTIYAFMEQPDNKMEKLMIKSEPRKRVDFTTIETSF